MTIQSVRFGRTPAVASRALRIGVVANGVLIEERVLPASVRRITVGSSPRATITVPGSPFAARPLFEQRGERCRLRLDLPIDGRISLTEGEVRTIEELRAGANCASTAEPPQEASKRNSLIELGDRTRGKLDLGGLTLLFQRVAAPAASPQPRLPPSIRGGLLGRVDWTLAASFVALIVLHGGGLALLRTVELPRAQPSTIPDGFVERLPQSEPPRGVTVQGLLDLGEKPIAKQPRAPVDAAPRAPGKARPGRRRPATAGPRNLEQVVSRMGALQVLGNRGRGEGDAVRDLLNSGRPDQEAARAFRGVGGVTVSARGPVSALRPRGHGPVRGVDIEGLADRVNGPTQVAAGEAAPERAPRGIVTRERAKVDETLRPVEVERVIRLGMPAVTTCFQRGIKRNPGLAGKTLIRIEVSGLGAVIGVSVDDDSLGDPQVNACIASYARRWRFPAPQGGGRAEVVVPFLFRAAAAP